MVALDVPGAFTLNAVASALLFLMVLSIVTPSFGLEYWVVLCTPFGWRPAEWGWQGVLALIIWRLRQLGFRGFIVYVDNFFFFYRKGTPVAARARKVRRAMAGMHVPWHEWQVGTRMRGLGWEWNTDDMVMVYPVDKHVYVLGRLREWAAKNPLSLEDTREAAGVLLDVSAGLPVGKSDCAHLVHMRTEGEAELRLKGGSPGDTMAWKTKEADAALRFWVKIMEKWDRTCPIFMDFGPMVAEQALGRVDAATKDGHGCGGFLWIPGERVLLGFAHVWSGEEKDRARCLLRSSTGVFESFGAMRWWRNFGKHVAGMRVLFEMDSECSVLALHRSYSGKPAMMECVGEVRKCAAVHHVVVRVRWIAGVLNGIADLLSHQKIGEAKCLALSVFGVELLLV